MLFIMCRHVRGIVYDPSNFFNVLFGTDVEQLKLERLKN